MLDNLKRELLQVAKDAEKSGLCRHKSGNFSIRDRKSNLVVVTPAGVDRNELIHEQICVVDMEANVIERLGDMKPTSELLMHLQIYKTRPDVNVIVHTHSKFATSFAVLKKPIPSIVYECAVLGLKEGIIPVADYGTPGTIALSNSVIDPIQKADVVLLESHGVVAVDKNSKDALLKANYVEELAEIYYRALMMNGGKEPNAISLDEIQKWRYPSEIKF